MIPKERKRGATMVTLVAFALVAVGAIVGLIWVSMYIPK
jgi:hypothetical protein